LIAENAIFSGVVQLRSRQAEQQARRSSVAEGRAGEAEGRVAQTPQCGGAR
jgi:hypothetical protein